MNMQAKAPEGFIDINQVIQQGGYIEGPSQYIVVTLIPVYWGRGGTPLEAIQDAKFIRAGDKVRLYQCTPDVELGGEGQLLAPSEDSRIVSLGIVTMTKNRALVSINDKR